MQRWSEGAMVLFIIREVGSSNQDQSRAIIKKIPKPSSTMGPGTLGTKKLGLKTQKQK